jgi:hypothetical protein
VVRVIRISELQSFDRAAVDEASSLVTNGVDCVYIGRWVTRLEASSTCKFNWHGPLQDRETLGVAPDVHYVTEGRPVFVTELGKGKPLETPIA